MKAITKIFDGLPQRLDNVAAGTDRSIRSVQVLNNTPYFLYVGREQNVGRENALFVVEPYTDVKMPVSEAQALYVNEGPAIGKVPANCQATILWDTAPCELAQRKTGRNVVIPLYQDKATAAINTALTAQGLGSTSGGLIGGSVGSGPSAATFAVPASAERRTIYGAIIAGGAKFTSATIEGSADGENWFAVADLLSSAATSFVYDVPTARALPPYLRLTAVQDAYDDSVAQINMVVDL